jgi:hypothetical protein
LFNIQPGSGAINGPRHRARHCTLSGYSADSAKVGIILQQLALDNADLDWQQMIATMVANPRLVERPIVQARCRQSAGKWQCGHRPAFRKRTECFLNPFYQANILRILP